MMRLSFGMIVIVCLCGAVSACGKGEKNNSSGVTADPERHVSDALIQECVEKMQPSMCTQYSPIIKVQKVDERQVQGGIEVLADVWFQVKEPFMGGGGDMGNIASRCTGTRWDMDPAKVNSTLVPFAGHRFLSGQKLEIETTLTFEKWNSGNLTCATQGLAASKAWYAH